MQEHPPFRRKPRELEAIDWDLVDDAWKELFAVELPAIKVRNLFTDITAAFANNPRQFMSRVRHAHELPCKLPLNFFAQDVFARARIFFAYFRYVFDFEWLQRVVKTIDFRPATICAGLSAKAARRFTSICALYRMGLVAAESHPPRVGMEWGMTLGRLLIPEGHRHLDSTGLHLQWIYLAPVEAGGRSGVFRVDASGAGSVAAGDEVFASILPGEMTGMVEGQHVRFYRDGTDPELTLTFPSVDVAADAFHFMVAPPQPGFMQMSAFLQSIANFQGRPKPAVLVEQTKACAKANNMELLLYAFGFPGSDVVSKTTIGGFLALLGDELMPFFRALVHSAWSSAPFAGSLVFRQNSSLTALTAAIIKMEMTPFVDRLLAEYQQVVMTQAGKISSATLEEEADVRVFLGGMFGPFAEFFLGQISKLPFWYRALHRTLVVRAAGTYVGERAPWIVMANLLLLRVVFAGLAEWTHMHLQDEKTKKVGLAVLNALIATALGLAPPGELASQAKHFIPWGPKLQRATLELIDVFGPLPERPQESDALENICDLLGAPAKRVVKMDMKEMNGVAKSHPYAASIMQMIEEFVFDFREVA